MSQEDEFGTPLCNNESSCSEESDSCSDACSEASYESCNSQDQNTTTDPRSKRASNVESRREQKIRKIDRQSSKKSFPLLQSLKPLWEQSRQSSISSKDRSSLIDQMFDQTKGQLVELIFKHDASRIIQTIIKYSNEQQRSSIYTELKGKFSELSQGKYSKHLVSKMLKLCPSKRPQIVQELSRNSKKMLRNRESSKILELIFMQYTNAKEKKFLALPLYCPEFKLLFPTTVDHSTTSNKKKGEGCKSLKELISECKTEEKKSKIISDLLEAITAALDKGLASNSFVHHLIAEYLQVCSEQQSADLMKMIREQLVEILHTHIGFKIVCQCISSSSVKERKAILKSFKPFLAKIAQDEFGHLVLICCLTLIDDIVLIEKTILPTDNSFLSNGNSFSQKILLFPFVGLSTKHFSQDFVQFTLNQLANSTKLEFSKKGLDQKMKELKALLLPSLSTILSNQQQTESQLTDLITDKVKSVLFMEVNENEELFLIPLRQPLVSNNVTHILLSENGGFFYKKLIQKNPGMAIKIYNCIKDSVVFFATKERSLFLILTLFNEATTTNQILSHLLPIKGELEEASKSNNKISLLYNQIFKK